MRSAKEYGIHGVIRRQLWLARESAGRMTRAVGRDTDHALSAPEHQCGKHGIHEGGEWTWARDVKHHVTKGSAPDGCVVGIVDVDPQAATNSTQNLKVQRTRPGQDLKERSVFGSIERSEKWGRHNVGHLRERKATTEAMPKRTLGFVYQP